MHDTVTMPDILPPRYRSWNELYYEAEKHLLPGETKVKWVEMDLDTKAIYEYIFTIDTIKIRAFNELRAWQLTENEVIDLFRHLSNDPAYSGMGARGGFESPMRTPVIEKLRNWWGNRFLPADPKNQFINALREAKKANITFQDLVDRGFIKTNSVAVYKRGILTLFWQCNGMVLHNGEATVLYQTVEQLDELLRMVFGVQPPVT